MKTISNFILTALVFFTISGIVQSQENQQGGILFKRIEQITPGQSVNDGNRETPPGQLLYSQPFSCLPWNAVPSIANEPVVQVADDFILTTNAHISIIRWWFLLYNNSPNSLDWIISIYNDQNCLPNSLAMTWTIPADSVHFAVDCNGAYGIHEFWSRLYPQFTPVPGQTYWISIQALGSDLNYWACYGYPGQYLNCSGVFKGEMYGVYEFMSINDFVGVAMDFNFELYSDEPGYTTLVPLTNWALSIGILLIVIGTGLRYRRFYSA